jgi:aryl-alcohol dehydrogenase-like predicted oxidoreductase
MLRTGKTTRREFLEACALSFVTMGSGAGNEVSGVRQFRHGGMVYRRLGHTDMDVSLLSFGSHTDPADRRPAGPGKTVLTAGGQARRDKIIARAFDLGVNLLDVYDSEGQWEPAARLVQNRRHQVLISLAHEVSPKDIDRAAGVFGYVDLYRFHTADIDERALENWDVLRKAKEAGKIRAIGIATHIERTMTLALEQLEGIDYLFFPYNFIHARADYSQFLPLAIRRGVGLIAMKPLASGSIANLDPLARQGTKPEYEEFQLWQRRNKRILPAAVGELIKSLDRMPDETLCMAAMRFVYSRSFVATAITGMFEERLLQDNYNALARYTEIKPEEQMALGAAKRLVDLCRGEWLPTHYSWLEEQWCG